MKDTFLYMEMNSSLQWDDGQKKEVVAPFIAEDEELFACYWGGAEDELVECLVEIIKEKERKKNGKQFGVK